MVLYIYVHVHKKDGKNRTANDRKEMQAERYFDPLTTGLMAQHASKEHLSIYNSVKNGISILQWYN